MNISQQLELIAKTTEKVNEAMSAYASYVSFAGTDERDIRTSLCEILMRLSDLTVCLTMQRDEHRSQWDDVNLIQAVITNGDARIKVACMKPNDHTDRPWITQAVFDSLKRRLVSDALGVQTAESFQIDVLNRSSRVISTINPL